MFLEIDGWTIERDRREDDLWLVYPTEEGSRSCYFKYFSSEREAIEFAYTHSNETE